MHGEKDKTHRGKTGTQMQVHIPTNKHTTKKITLSCKPIHGHGDRDRKQRQNTKRENHTHTNTNNATKSKKHTYPRITRKPNT